MHHKGMRLILICGGRPPIPTGYQYGIGSSPGSYAVEAQEPRILARLPGNRRVMNRHQITSGRRQFLDLDIDEFPEQRP